MFTTLNRVWPKAFTPRAAICVQHVDVRVSCSSHYDAQFAAVFIDPRAKGSTELICVSHPICSPQLLRFTETTLGFYTSRFKQS